MKKITERLIKVEKGESNVILVIKKSEGGIMCKKWEPERWVIEHTGKGEEGSE